MVVGSFGLTLVDVAATMGRLTTMSARPPAAHNIMPVVLGRLLVLPTIHAI